MDENKQPVHLETRDINGRKLISPSSTRNCEPIGAVFSPLLPTNAHVLEVASGTGQHAAHMCTLRSDIHWQMSDIDARSRESQNAYACDFPDQLPSALSLDVMAENWWKDITDVSALYCANMIHIAPWGAALGLAKGAGKILSTGNIMCLYGPFLCSKESAPSNLEFDRNLKRRNPEWGVRTLETVKHIFADCGLDLDQAIEMPCNNFFLIFKRT